MTKQSLLDELKPLLPNNQVASAIADRLQNEQDEQAIRDYLAMCHDAAIAILLATPHKVIELGRPRPGHPSEFK
jgi:hypothetical protein